MFIVKIFYRDCECCGFDYSIFENMAVTPFKTRKEANDFIMRKAENWLSQNKEAQKWIEERTGSFNFPQEAYEDIEEMEDYLIQMEDDEIYSFIFEIDEFDDFK